MRIRKLLTGMLISAMLAGSFCFPVPADELEPAAAVQTVVIEETETETETESETETETETVAETVAESAVETEAETETETETETEIETETETGAEPEVPGTDAEAATQETIVIETEAVPGVPETEVLETEALESETPETEAPETEIETDEENVLLETATPRAATGLKATAGDTYVTLEFKKGADAKGNRIEMYDESADTYTWVYATELEKYKVTGLKPNHNYRFRLLAWSGSTGNFTFGEYTAWVSARTRLYTPATPTGLTAAGSGTSSLKVSWKASNYAQKYRVRVYDNNTKTSFWGAFTASTSATITGLNSKHTYKVRVQAYRNAAGTYTYSGYTSWVSASSGTANVVVSAKLITPGAPSGLKAVPGDKSVKLSWNAGTSAHKYRVRIYDCVTRTSSWAAFTSSTSVTITGLQNNHSYKFRVQAYRNNSGTYTFSSYTPWQAVAVTPLGTAEAIGWNNSVILSWPKVAGATQYKIYSVNTSTGKRTWIKSVGGSTLECRISGLKNGSTYAYRVYAYKNGTAYTYSGVLKATAADPRTKYVSTALSYLGAKEGSALHKEIIDLYNTQNPVPAGYKMTYTAPWCAAFATAMAVKANVIRMIPGECSCTRQIALWKQLGYYISDPGTKKSYTPSVGDLVYYSWTKNASSPDHVGIVSKVSGSTLYVVEGNKSNAVGERVIENYKSYGYIIGYGRPNGN